MRRHFISWALVLMIGLLTSTAVHAAKEVVKPGSEADMEVCRAELNLRLENLADALTDNLPSGSIKRVALLDPVGPGDTLTDFSAYVVDQLNGYLADMTSLALNLNLKKKTFDAVLERRRLQDIITQQRVEMSTHFDPKTVTPLGKKLGVDGLIFMEVTDLGNSLLLRAKLVGVERGAVMSSDSVSVQKNALVRRLLATSLVSSLTVKLEPDRLKAMVSLDDQSIEYTLGGLHVKDIPQGMHRLVVRADCHEDYRLSFYLASPRNFTIRPEPRRGRLELTVVPPRAVVKVDNEHLMEMDDGGVGSIELAAGLHTVTAHAENLAPFSRRISMPCRPLAMSIDLTKPLVTLSLEVQPATARVRMDGEPVGLDAKGRWSGKVRQGEHEIQVDADYHQDLVRRVDIEEDLALSLELKPKLYPLTVKFQPQGAEVKLDGRPMTQVSPGVAETKIEAGSHELEVAAPGSDPYLEKIAIPQVREKKVCLTERPLRVEIAAVYDDDGQVRSLEQGAVLRSDQNYAVAVKPMENAYVYVLQVDGGGKVAQLFPSPQLSQNSNPLGAKTWHWIPPKSHWLYLDYTTGRERIYFLASRVPDEKLEGLLARLRSAVDDAMLASLSHEFTKEMRTRGPAGTRPAGRIHASKQNGRPFQAVTQVIESCGQDWFYMLEFEHR